jgi:hypothetical protein
MDEPVWTEGGDGEVVGMYKGCLIASAWGEDGKVKVGRYGDSFMCNLLSPWQDLTIVVETSARFPKERKILGEAIAEWLDSLDYDEIGRIYERKVSEAG